MKRAALVGGSIGAVIALGIWLLYAFFGYMAGPETVVLWPASIAMLGLETQRSFSLAVAVWLVAGLVNALLYAALGCCALAAFRMVAPNRGTGA